jgi:hypothetical protein
MRAGLFVLLAACAASLVVGAACSSFGGDELPDVDAAGPEAAPSEGGPLCSPPPRQAPLECLGDCVARSLFGDQAAEQAFVSGNAAYIVKQQTVQVSTDLDTGVFAQLDQGPAIKGDARRMDVDEKHVYVSTTLEHVRVAIGGGTKDPMPLFEGDLSPVFWGRSVLYQLQPTHVIRSPKSGSAAGVAKKIDVLPTEALAVDGDTAYWVGVNSAGEHAIQGPFPDAVQRALVKAPVRGFVVKDELAYVAEVGTTEASSVISRLGLRDGKRLLLVDEPGKIESLSLHGGKLYWVARRVPTEGDRVLVTVDPCNGAATVLATSLPPLAQLSFAGQYAYAASLGPGPIYRTRK